ncbi:TPM domain-containing protein [uncultured Cytophaga sp.]|uniref:TPM domain-containing protein n=1 Tax=uncultured Cytophaga sp. TaxID=160238 RepID=UPI00262630F0|nr:TPM domain-containing protein [uncultured Cytophaga sp.]
MPHSFFNAQETAALNEAIQEAEKSTSGEIRLHIENVCKYDVLDRAADVFADLAMHKTELRNGVLFYLSIKDRKFAIIGDAGINTKVPAGFWDSIKEIVLTHFKNNLYAQGLSEGIKKAGSKLSEHFPYSNNDVNELPNDISFKKN